MFSFAHIIYIFIAESVCNKLDLVLLCFCFSLFFVFVFVFEHPITCHTHAYSKLHANSYCFFFFFPFFCAQWFFSFANLCNFVLRGIFFNAVFLSDSPLLLALFIYHVMSVHHQITIVYFFLYHMDLLFIVSVCHHWIFYACCWLHSEMKSLCQTQYWSWSRAVFKRADMVNKEETKQITLLLLSKREENERRRRKRNMCTYLMHWY